MTWPTLLALTCPPSRVPGLRIPPCTRPRNRTARTACRNPPAPGRRHRRIAAGSQPAAAPLRPPGAAPRKGPCGTSGTASAGARFPVRTPPATASPLGDADPVRPRRLPKPSGPHPRPPPGRRARQRRRNRPELLSRRGLPPAADRGASAGPCSRRGLLRAVVRGARRRARARCGPHGESPRRPVAVPTAVQAHAGLRRRSAEAAEAPADRERPELTRSPHGGARRPRGSPRTAPAAPPAGPGRLPTDRGSTAPGAVRARTAAAQRRRKREPPAARKRRGTACAQTRRSCQARALVSVSEATWSTATRRAAASSAAAAKAARNGGSRVRGAPSRTAATSSATRVRSRAW